MQRYIYIGDLDGLPDYFAALIDLSAQYELDAQCVEVLERMTKDSTGGLRYVQAAVGEEHMVLVRSDIVIRTRRIITIKGLIVCSVSLV